MANLIIDYLKKSINPGGTPTRLKEWAGFILMVQVIVLFIGNVLHDPFDFQAIILLGVFAQVWIFWFIHKSSIQLVLLRWLIYTGLAVQVVAVYYTDAEIAGTVFFMVWSSITLLAERRSYFGVGLGLFLFMLVFISLAMTIYLANDRTIDSSTSIATFISGICFVWINFYLLYTDYKADKLTLQSMQLQFERLQAIAINMSEILNRKEQIENLLWHVTQCCIPLLGLDDFVIYLYDKNKDRLVQVAAYGDKTFDGKKIINPIDIAPGQGVVGTCFFQKTPVLVSDTSLEENYIVDDARRASELAVPIFSGDEVVGVLDSESPVVNYYGRHHLQVFEVIAAFCGIKITDDRAKDQIREAEGARQLAEQFKELDELKNRFISNISHDLKTPLSLIKGPVQQILRGSSMEETIKNAGYIQKNTDHLLHMVEQLLQLQRLDHGLKHLYPERFLLQDILRPLEEQFASIAEEKRITMDSDYPHLFLFTDRFKLQQCVHNLLQNAFRYAPKGGRVRIHAYVDKDGLHIQVQDDGPGVQAESRKKIFDRFYKTDVNNHEGTGIGLSLVREYMQMIGGEVDYRQSEWGGAAFILHLGIQNLEEREQSSMTESPAPDPGKVVILVVEDHPELNEFIASILRSEYQVLQAFDGEQAWKICREEIPDLVLADLMLPGMQGEELLARIKEKDDLAHIPVVILSSKSKVPDKVELYALGAENYLVKPFDASELLAVIRNCFVRRRQLQELFFKDRERLANNEENGQQTNEDKLLGQAMGIILENLDDPKLNGQLLCDQLGFGRNRLQREIKSATGLSPAEFIRSVRLNEANKMLKNPGLNVSEVAYSVGFNNLSYFTRAFKAQFDVLPSEMKQISHH
ncbi:MAG: response regulator [Bacteroidia bacterium]